MRKLLVFIFLNFLFINVFAVEDATLKNIKVNGKECVCVEYVCEMEVNESSVTLTYELSDSNAVVDRESGLSTPITSSVTNIKVNVTNGESHVSYEFIINKHVKSGDYSLKKLSLNDEEITLTEDVYVYSKAVAFDEENIIIDAVCNDSKASVDKELVFLFPVDESSKSFDFEVTAENGDVKNYRIIVTRKSKPDTTLKSLKIDKGTINFNKNIFEYNISVDYIVNDLLIEAIPNDQKANVKITKDTLVVGDNVITIEVVNEELSSLYTLNVNRAPNLDMSQANLEKLEIAEYSDLDFDSNVLDYELVFEEIPNSLTINAVSVNDNTKIEIIDNKDLQENDIVSIKVTLDDSEVERIYTLKISKSVVEVENKLPIIITLIVLVIVIIVLLILSIIDSRKKKRGLTKKVKKVKEEVEEIEII